MTLPCLLVQKAKNSKAKYHLRKLKDRLRLWTESNTIDINQKARTIQNRFRNSTLKKRTHEDSICSFIKHVEGQNKRSTQNFEEDYENGVLQLDQKVLKILKFKHLTMTEVKKDSLLHGPMNKISSCYLDEIDEK